MALIRDYTDSRLMNMLSPQAENLFCRLLTQCDDFGNFTADPEIIKSRCFPLKTRYRLTDVQSWIAELLKPHAFAPSQNATSLIRLYTASGKEFLHIPKFGCEKKYKKRIYPPPEVEVETEVEVEEEVGYTRPRDFLLQVNEIEFEHVKMKSGLGAEFELCAEQWSLSVEGQSGEKAFKYSGNKSEDYRILKALFQKWVNSWNSNSRKEKSFNRTATNKDKVGNLINANQEAKNLISDD